MTRVSCLKGHKTVLREISVNLGLLKVNLRGYSNINFCF